MLKINIDNDGNIRRIAGIAKAKDIKEKGLLRASVECEER